MLKKIYLILLLFLLILSGCDEAGNIKTFKFEIGMEETSEGGAIDTSISTSPGVYPINTEITIAASAANSYEFNGWYDAAAGGSLIIDENPTAFLLLEDTAVYARYSLIIRLNAPAVNSTTGLSTELTIPTWSWSSNTGALLFRYSLTDGSGWVETESLTFTPDSALTPGAHTLFVQEGDGRGNWSASGQFTVTITEPGATVAPVVEIVGGDRSLANGDSITLSLNVTDPDSDLFSYAWSVDAGGAVGNGAEFLFTRTPAVETTYQVTISITDSDGNTGTDSISIVVAAPHVIPDPVQPAVEIIGGDRTVANGEEVVLTLDITDPDSSEFVYSWTKDYVLLVEETGSTYRFQEFPAGDDSYRIEVTVTDSDDLFSSDSILITVEAPPEPPLVESTVPVEGAEVEDMSAPVSVVFDKPLDPSSVTGASVHLSDGENTINCTLTLTNDTGGTLTIQPDAPLNYRSSYQLTIDTTVLSAEGAALEEAFDLSFTTAPYNPFEGLAVTNTVESYSDSTGFREIHGLDVYDDRMFLYVEKGGFEGFYLQVADITDPADPVFLGESASVSPYYSNLGFRPDTGNITFLPTNRWYNGTGGYSYGFATLGLDDEPVLLASTTLSSGTSLSYDYVCSLELVGKYLYAALNHSNEGGLGIYDVADPVHPAIAGAIITTWGNECLDVVQHEGNLILLTKEGIRILSISDPENPLLVGSWDYTGAGNIYTMGLYGDYLFISVFSNDTLILNISDPQNPVESGTLDFNAGSGSFIEYGDYCLVYSTMDSDLKVLDMSIPDDILILETLSLNEGVSDYSLVGSDLYLAYRDYPGGYFHIQLPSAALPSVVPVKAVLNAPDESTLPPMSVNLSSSSSLGDIASVTWVDSLGGEGSGTTHSLTIDEPGQWVTVFLTAVDSDGNSHTEFVRFQSQRFLESTGEVLEFVNTYADSYTDPKLYMMSDGSFLTSEGDNEDLSHYQNMTSRLRMISGANETMISGVAMDSSGNYYACADDSTDWVRKFNSSGTQVAEFTAFTSFGQPKDLELQGAYVFVKAQNEVLILNQSDLSLVRSITDDIINEFCIEVDAAGNIWIPDYVNDSGTNYCEFRNIDQTGVTLGSLRLNVSGLSSFNYNCKDFFFDDQGNVYVLYLAGSTRYIMKFDSSGELIFTHTGTDLVDEQIFTKPLAIGMSEDHFYLLSTNSAYYHSSNASQCLFQFTDRSRQ